MLTNRLNIPAIVTRYENHGNDVIARSSHTSMGAYKSWVDTTITLPAGELRNFSVYIHDKHELPIPFRLQLWQMIDPARHRYKLAFERRVMLPSLKGFHEVSDEQLIGWG